MNYTQERLRAEQLASAEAIGYKYGTGERRGFTYCGCHRFEGCNDWSKQGIYTLKMARTAADKLFAGDDAAHAAFITGFKAGDRATIILAQRRIQRPAARRSRRRQRLDR